MDEALISLLDKKDFEYISIKEVCEKAGVNRSTFYLHYENTSELLDETVRYMINNFLSYFTLENSPLKKGVQNCELTELMFITEKYLEPYLSYIKNNGKVFATALKHAGSLGFEKIYNKMFFHIFSPVLARFNCPDNERQYTMLFYLNGINSIVSAWLENGYKESITEISNIIIKCVMGNAEWSPPREEDQGRE